MGYLENNKIYWSQGYPAPSVDHPIFRFYGRILKPEFNMGGNFEKLVDFGCGQGAAVEYFSKMGFNARGVDISETDIDTAKKRYPHLSNNFLICDPNPRNNEFYGFENGIAVVTAIQALYFLSDEDFKICMQKIYDSMKKGGIFFATMMGEQSREYFDNSVEYGNGLRKVSFKNDRLDVDDYYMFFIKNEEHLKEKFSMFKPLHIGYYCAKFRNDEGDGFHYTFCGIKE